DAEAVALLIFINVAAVVITALLIIGSEVGLILCTDRAKGITETGYCTAIFVVVEVTSGQVASKLVGTAFGVVVDGVFNAVITKVATHTVTRGQCQGAFER